MTKKPPVSAPDRDGPGLGARRQDGCQNCKTGRIKCDKNRPICGCCERRKQACNYSKIQFNTINKSTHDKRTGRKMKLATNGNTASKVEIENEKSPMKKTSFKSPKSQKNSLRIIHEDPAQSTTGQREPQLPTPATSPSTSSVSEAASSYRYSNIHQLLWPSEIDNPPESEVAAGSLSRRSSISTVSHTVKTPELSCITNSELERTPTWSSFAEAHESCDHAQVDRPNFETLTEILGSKAGVYTLCAPRADLVDFTAFTSPAVAAILRYSNARLLLHHYLNRSIATLHPQLGCSEHNTSAAVFFPYCLAYPVALEAILAFSAAQLSLLDPRQAKALLYHKACSIKHLNRLVHQQAHPSDSEKTSEFSLDLVVSVLSQISVAVSESGLDSWQMHCRAAFSILACMQKPEAWECSRNLEAYLYCRLLKYLCFAEIAKPSSRALDLSIIQGSNLTVEFGVPSSGLKLAVMITKYTCLCEEGSSTDEITRQGEELTLQLREYLTSEAEEVTILSDSSLVEAIWRSAIWLYYYRCVYNTTAEHDTSIVALSRIVNYLKLIPLSSLHNTALAFPVQNIVPLLRKQDRNLRLWLHHYCRQLAYSTNTRNFNKIGEFSALVWAAMDAGTCRTIQDVRSLAEETGYLILAA